MEMVIVLSDIQFERFLREIRRMTQALSDLTDATNKVTTAVDNAIAAGVGGGTPTDGASAAELAPITAQLNGIATALTNATPAPAGGTTTVKPSQAAAKTQ